MDIFTGTLTHTYYIVHLIVTLVRYCRSPLKTVDCTPAVSGATTELISDPVRIS